MAPVSVSAGRVAATPYAWPHDRPIEAARTALIVIDMQRDFCLADGYFATAGGDIDPVGSLTPRIAALLAAARSSGLLVAHTREGHRPDLSDAPEFKLWRSENAGARIGSEGPLGRRLVRGEPGWEIVEALTPQAGEPVIDKPGYSAFHATDLDALLRLRGIAKLILCGVTTDVCVHSTLRSAVDLGFECLLVEDACAAADPALHAACLRIVHGEGGIFGATASTAAILTALEQAEGEAPARKAAHV